MTQTGKNPHATQVMGVQSPGQEDPLEKERATHSSILAWEIPSTEESGGLQFMGSQRVGNHREIKQEPIKTPSKPNSDASKKIEMDMCTLQYLIQITNKDLLYRTGNSAQYIFCNNFARNEFEKEHIYIYIYIYIHTHIYT